MRILLYISIVLAGAFIGSRGKISEVVLKNLSKLQYACLLLLLFIMGVNIGINDEIINTFGKLGMQAVVLSVASILLSVGAVKLVSAYVLGRGREEQRHES